MKDRLIKEISHDYKIISFLGKGAFGTVIECKNITTHQEVALKVIKKYKLTEKQIQASIQESELLSKLEHPNIVNFIALHHTDSFLILEMELLKGKSLGELISHKGLPETQCAQIMQQIFCGVSYLHKVQVLHRDLKPDNIMFVDQNHCHLKITDFGLSTKYTLEERLEQRSGTRAYMAPEQFLLKHYSEPIDIWSCGIILYQLITGKHPFEKVMGEDFAKVLQNIKWDFQEGFPSLAKNLFLRCTRIDPLERYTASLALQHPWINGGKGKIPMTHMEQYRSYHDKLKLKKMVITCINLVGIMPKFSLGSEYLRKLNDPDWRKKEPKIENQPKKMNSMTNIDFKLDSNSEKISQKKSIYGNRLGVPNISIHASSPSGIRHSRISSQIPSRSPSPNPNPSTIIPIPKTALNKNRSKFTAHPPHN